MASSRRYESALRASLFLPATGYERKLYFKGGDRLFYLCRRCGRELLFGSNCWCQDAPQRTRAGIG